MDRLDRQIVHCLQHDSRASFRHIAETVGAAQQTVARRYRALCADGAVRVVGLAAPQHRGAPVWIVRIRCRPGTSGPLADALAGREDVSWVSITSGGGEVVCTSYGSTGSGSVLLDRLPRSGAVLSFSAQQILRGHDSDATGWLAFDDPLSDSQLQTLLADGAARGVAHQPGRGPALTADDAALLTELARDGRAGVVALAEATGWPRSRVAARLAELLDSGAVEVQLDLLAERFGFHATAYIWLTVPLSALEATGRALARHPETGYVAAVSGATNLMAAVTCRDVDALYTYVTTDVGALPSVQHAEVVPVVSRVKQAGARLHHGRREPAPARRPGPRR